MEEANIKLSNRKKNLNKTAGKVVAGSRAKVSHPFGAPRWPVTGCLSRPAGAPFQASRWDAIAFEMPRSNRPTPSWPGRAGHVSF